MRKSIKLLLFLLSVLFVLSCSDKSDEETQIINANNEKWEWEEEKSIQEQVAEKTNISEKKDQVSNSEDINKAVKTSAIKRLISINTKEASIKGNTIDININLNITLDTNDLRAGKSINITANTSDESAAKELKLTAKVDKVKNLDIKSVQKKELRDITKTVNSNISKKEQEAKKEEKVKTPAKIIKTIDTPKESVKPKEKVAIMKTESKPKEMKQMTAMENTSKSKDTKNASAMGDKGAMKGMDMGGGAKTGILSDTLKVDGYQVKITSDKPLVVGDNDIKVVLSKDGTSVTDAKVKVKFFMPEMPGMPYMEYNDKLKFEGDTYRGLVNYSMGGTWQYRLKFKTSDDVIHTVRGSVNL